MPLLTCLGKNLTPYWIVHPPLNTCEGMRIAVRMKYTQTNLHPIPQLVVQPLLTPLPPMHQHWKLRVQYNLLVPQKANLHLKCPILNPHNLIIQLIVFSYSNQFLQIPVVVKNQYQAVLCPKVQEEVQEVPKVHPQHDLVKYIPTALLYLRLINQLSINRLHVFLSIKQIDLLLLMHVDM